MENSIKNLSKRLETVTNVHESLIAMSRNSFLPKPTTVNNYTMPSAYTTNTMIGSNSHNVRQSKWVFKPI